MGSRADLLAAVTGNLQRIKQADGYQTDVGQYVTTEPTQVGDDAAAVVAVLLEGQVRATDQAVLKTHRLTTVAIVVKAQAADTREAMAMVDALAEDVEGGMDDRRFTYPVGVQVPQFVSMEPLVPEPGSPWVGAVLRYTSHIPRPQRPNP